MKSSAKNFGLVVGP